MGSKSAEIVDIRKKLVSYIREEFPGPMRYNFCWDLVENVIEECLIDYYAGEGDLDKAIKVMSCIIPEVTEMELMNVIKEV